MKKLTKEQAYRLLKKKYGNYGFNDMVDGLCISMPKSVAKDFIPYWESMNHKNRSYMWSYFKHYPSREEISILRLLVACQFIEETYK